MSVAVITPIVLQNERMLNIYLANLASYNFVVDTKIYLICNRLTLDVKFLADKMKEVAKTDFDIFNDKERSVAGAWNFGLRNAINEGFDTFHILAADIALHRDTQKILLDKINEVDVCSSVDFKSSYGKTYDDYGAADFSSVFLKRSTIDKFGYFDREYKPAYFEDNDYMIRLYTNNGTSMAVNSAIHYHYGSATINVDAEMAHHVKWWFETNRQRFIRKWGQDTGKNVDGYFMTPMNSGAALDWYPEKDKDGYTVDGGMHE